MASHRGTDVDGFHTRVGGVDVAVSESRAEFEDWLRDTEASEDTVDELMIVFSELVSNAVRASSGASEDVAASAWTERDKIVLRVANPVMSSSAPVAQPDLDDPLRTGGRGLVIVRAYTDDLATELDEDTIAIRCERRIRE